MKFSFLFLSLVLCLFVSCFNSISTYTIKTDPDLFPEGIAIHKEDIFISSILHNKIVRYNVGTKMTEDFISGSAYGFGPGIGIFAKDTLLYALSNRSSSELFIFNNRKQNLEKKYTLNDQKSHLWNDLVVDQFNNIYITDTYHHKIYHIRYPDPEIQEFFHDSSRIQYPNGISLSDDNTRMFIASYTKGIKVLDLATKTILNEDSEETKGIDGLKYYNHRVYGVVNASQDLSQHRLISVRFSKSHKEIIQVDTLLINQPLFNVPTTIDIQNGSLYLLCNSQMDNLDQQQMKAIDSSKLTDTYILKMNLH